MTGSGAETSKLTPGALEVPAEITLLWRKNWRFGNGEEEYTTLGIFEDRRSARVAMLFMFLRRPFAGLFIISDDDLNLVHWDEGFIEV